MNCVTCGAELRPGAMFCGECGARVVKLVTPVDPVPPAAAPAAPVLVEPARSESAIVDEPDDDHPFWMPQPTPAVARYTAQQSQPTIALPGLPFELTQERPAPEPQRSIPRFAPIDLDDDDGEPEADFDETIVAPRRLPWTITGPDGIPHQIRTATVIGRAPQRPGDRPTAALLALPDPTKSLSKSHAIFEPDGDSLLVIDVGSTNGVVIMEPDGSETVVPAGRRVPLGTGVNLELGDYTLVIGRG